MPSEFPPCVIDGVARDLSHLDPFDLRFHVLKLGREITIEAHFSNHCYTVAFDAEIHDAAHVIMDHRRRRAFDQERYELSRHLPGILNGLPEKAVHLMPRERNFGFVTQLEIEGKAYALFFHLRPSSRNPRNLYLMVESAYPVENFADILRGSTRIAFPVLCAKVSSGEAVKPHTRR